MKKVTGTLVIFLLFSLYACLPVDSSPTVKISTQSSSSTPVSATRTALSTKASTPPPIMIEPTASVTPFRTRVPTWNPTPVSKTVAVPECVLQLAGDTGYAETAFPGTIFYYDDDLGQHFTLSSDLGTRLSLSSFDIPGFEFIGFSPDGQRAAFIDNHIGSPENPLTQLTVIIMKDGEIIEHLLDLTHVMRSVPPPLYLAELAWPNYWINDELLYISLWMATPPIGSQHLWPFFLVLDSVAAEWRTDLIEHIPYFQKDEVHTRMMAGFSPDLKYLAYDFFDPFNSYLILHNLVEKKDVFKEMEMPFPNGMYIQWSEDSKAVAYTNYQAPWEKDRRVILFYPDGMVRKPLTTMDGPFEQMYFSEFAWSYNSRYLAILGETYKVDSPKSVLFIYDREVDQMIAQCSFGSSALAYPNLFWSPDNRYVAINNKEDIEQSRLSNILIFDLETGQLYDSGVRGKVIGWQEGSAGEWR